MAGTGHAHAWRLKPDAQARTYALTVKADSPAASGRGGVLVTLRAGGLSAALASRRCLDLLPLRVLGVVMVAPGFLLIAPWFY